MTGSLRAMVLRGYGINCERETAYALGLAGARVDLVMIQDLLGESRSFADYQLLVIPGGFSFGDDIHAGRVLAGILRYQRLPSGDYLLNQLIAFTQRGGLVLGICNGFQVLVNLGLLPGLSPEREQQVALFANRSGKFENRWCRVRVASRSPLLEDGVLTLPVRHGEGRLLCRDPQVAQQIIAQKLVCMTYCDESGQGTDQYPQNPNGSWLNAAGLCDPTGQVIGMMPHPEAFFRSELSPYPAERMTKNRRCDGVRFFQHMVKKLVKR